MDSIMGNNTWVLADLLSGCKPLGCKWIFKRKLKVDRTIETLKARSLVQKLRQFLDKKIRFKELKLHINVGCIESIESEVIEFDHVELEAEWFEYKDMYELVVDSLLWCCRPQYLTLIIYFSLLEFEEWESVVEYTYEKLLQQEDQAHTNIQFVMSSSPFKAKMNFSDLSTLLEALRRDESIQKILS
nr:F-box domain, leucine-rich repeat domain, L domain-like protein [Tanacetum cinerariifolium]